MSRLGTEIRNLRNEKGLSQKQLAKLVGVSESYIEEIETGKKVLNGSMAIRITKVLGRQDESLEFYSPEQQAGNEAPQKAAKPKATVKPVQEFWTDALGGLIKSVPVYDYKMDKVIDTVKMPVISGKVEGCPKDKVFYIKIEDEDMTGFRISKGDLGLACSGHEAEKDGIYFVEYQNKRFVRNIKRIDSEKLLVVSNKGTISTQVVPIKEIKVLGKLLRIEITL